MQPIKTKTEEQVKTTKLADLRSAYNKLAVEYNRIVNHDLIYCPCANAFLAKSHFYKSEEYPFGYFPICKEELARIAEPPGIETRPEEERKSDIQDVLHVMNLPYLDPLYKTARRMNVEGKVASTFQQYIAMVTSSPAYQGLKWKDSSFGISADMPDSSAEERQKIIAAAMNRFGPGFLDDEYLFLEEQYQEWISQYECETKAQAELYERLCFKKLDILKAQQTGVKTNDLDKSFMELLDSVNALPRKETPKETALSEDIIGLLTQKIEEAQPIGKTDKEDFDGIGYLIDCYYKGATCDALGVKNSNYDKYKAEIDKYTVLPPDYETDENVSDIYDKAFGRGEE